MKKLGKFAAVCALSALATACTDGYYDSRGHYHEGDAASNQDNAVYYNNHVYYTDDGKNYYTDHAARKGDAAGVIGYDRNRDATLHDKNANDGDVTIVYNRYGYYDSTGRYYPVSSRPSVARSYFPARGLCRVWLDGVAAAQQPSVESCDGIQSRAPAGSYIMYGG
jgi:hypothetical protein